MPTSAKTHARAARIGDDVLRRVARFEGISRPEMPQLAERLEVSPHTAWRQLDRLREAGVVKTVTAVDPRQTLGRCECRAFLKLDCLKPALEREFEDRLRASPQVVTAARITGPWDYIVRAFHRSERETNVWFRALLEEPGVLRGQLKFCRTVVERNAFAAAVLGSCTRAAEQS